MNEAEFHAHFNSLNAHLVEVRPIFNDFCNRHAFSFAERPSIGRYPRIRIVRCGAPKLWFDLMMELDPDGRRYEHFTRASLYELGAGAFLDIEDSPNNGTRHSISFWCFKSKPFDQIGTILKDQLELNLNTLAGFDAGYILKNGEMTRFGSAAK